MKRKSKQQDVLSDDEEVARITKKQKTLQPSAASTASAKPTKSLPPPPLILLEDDDDDETEKSKQDDEDDEELKRAIALSLEVNSNSSKSDFKFNGKGFYLNKLNNSNAQHVISLQQVLELDKVKSCFFTTYSFEMEWFQQLLKPLIDGSSTSTTNCSITVVKHYASSQEKQGKHFFMLGKKKELPLCIVNPKLVSPYSNVHSKLWLLEFPTFLRVVVCSGNLTSFDWEYYTQVLWIQDFGLKSTTTTGAAATNSSSSSSSKQQQRPSPPSAAAAAAAASKFEQSLLKFWQSCTDGIPSKWLQRYDFSTATCDLVSSVPGYHKEQDMKHYGHMRLRALVKEYTDKTKLDLSTTPVYFQTSTIGTVDTKWCTEFSKSLGVAFTSTGSSGATATTTTSSSSKQTKLKLKSKTSKEQVAEAETVAATGSTGTSQPLLRVVFPTLEAVYNSKFGLRGGGMIHFKEETYNSEKFPKSILHEYAPAQSSQAKILPHSKIIVQAKRVKSKLVGWMYLGSHNFSPAALGRLQKEEKQLFVLNYEMGVFLPFEVDAPSDDESTVTSSQFPSWLPLPFEFPPKMYQKDSQPFILSSVE